MGDFLLWLECLPPRPNFCGPKLNDYTPKHSLLQLEFLNQNSITLYFVLLHFILYKTYWGIIYLNNDLHIINLKKIGGMKSFSKLINDPCNYDEICKI